LLAKAYQRKNVAEKEQAGTFFYHNKSFSKNVLLYGAAFYLLVLSITVS
jgi:hypothetical protein